MTAPVENYDEVEANWADTLDGPPLKTRWYHWAITIGFMIAIGLSGAIEAGAL